MAARKSRQTKIKGTGPKELPDLVKAAEELKAAQEELGDAKATVSAAQVDLMVLCRKYVASGDLTIDKEAHGKSKIPVFLYRVQVGEDLVTRKISHGFQEGVSVTKAKRSEVDAADTPDPKPKTK